MTSGTSGENIAIRCQTAEHLTLDALTPLQGKLKRLNKTAAVKLRKSILQYGFSAPIFIWQHDARNCILDGHQRVTVLRQMRDSGYTIPPLPVVYIEARDEAEAKAKLLHITGMYGSFSRDGYKDFVAGLDVSQFLDTLKLPAHFALQPTMEQPPAKLAKKQTFELHPDIKKLLDGLDTVALSYSGGKDSTLTAYLLRPYLEEKRLILLHVDTGAEYPDLIPYIVEVAHKLDAELSILHPKEHIVAAYCQQRRWPQPLTKDCIHRYINAPLDKAQAQAKRTVLVRGGRATRATWKTMRRVAGPIEEKNGKILVNPIYDLDDKAVDRFLVEAERDIGLWPGYARGFTRTACWFCPFQKREQYRALRECYPLLYEKLLEFRNTWEASTDDLCVLRYITQGGQVRD